MIFRKLLYLCGMLALIIAILCIVSIVFSLWLIGYGLRRIDDYKWMTKDDYQQLNEKAKRIVRLRKAKRAERKRLEKERQDEPYHSTISCMDHGC